MTDDMSQALYLQTKIDTQSTGVVERLSNGETDAVLKDYNAHPVDEEYAFSMITYHDAC